MLGPDRDMPMPTPVLQIGVLHIQHDHAMGLKGIDDGQGNRLTKGWKGLN